MDAVRGIARLLWEPMMGIHVSWRAAAVLLAAQLLLYAGMRLFGRRLVRAAAGVVWKAGEMAAALVVLPEFLLTRRLRAAGHPPLPGTYAVGFGVEAVACWLAAGHQAVVAWSTRERPRRVGRWKRTLVMVSVVAAVPVLAWEVRPHVGVSTTLARYIDDGISSWCAVETWVFDVSGARSRCESTRGQVRLSHG